MRISDVAPQLECGRYPLKRVLGETVEVQATVVADGHVQVRAELRYRPVGTRRWNRIPMLESSDEPDRFAASFRVESIGRWEYTVGAWVDAAATWHDELRRKVEAGETELAAELAEGEQLLGVELSDVEAALAAPAEVRVAKTSLGRPLTVVAEPVLAAFGAWYELFPRSFGGFDGVRAVLPEIADLGFDVVYLPPIHPIGTTNRKGRNNALVATPDDPGSPWAIGGAEGGHKAVHPDLGTLDDFDRLVERARELGLEVALDFAVQCSPDHPWLEKHPEWFAWRPDGSVKYAENPPKRYQDIVNVDFDSPKAKQLWEALLGVVEHWIGHGVRVFRVDNPHTKPFAFWEWLITTVHEEHPEVVFLAEAFTRPAVMSTLAKLGFSQSYTYFTWRNTRAELETYVGELSEQTDWFRPNFFVNTPDIFHEYLQQGGPAGVRGSHRAGGDVVAVVGDVLGVRARRGRRGAPGQRGVPRLGEVPVLDGRGRGRAQPARAALQRDPSRLRRVPPRRQRHLLRHRARADRRLREGARCRRGHRVREPRPARRRRGTGRRSRRRSICPRASAWSTSSPATDYEWRVGGNYLRLPPGGAHVLAVR